MKGIGGLIAGGIIGLFAVSVLFGSWYTVDQGYRGVILRNGAVVGMAQPGLGFKAPIIDSVYDISVQTHVETFDKMVSYSADQQPAEMRVSVNYRLLPDKVAEVYATYQSLEGLLNRLIRPHVFQATKVVFGQYTAARAIQDRGKLNADTAAAIQSAVGDDPVVIESVQIENIDFSDAYEASIEQRMLAEVEVQKIRQNAEREKVNAEITVTKARAAADAVRAQAQAEADAIKLRGEAEAQAIEARGKALRDNPALVSLVQAEKWNGALPTTMVPGSALPMMNLGR